jgi:hypothetical protein
MNKKAWDLRHTLSLVSQLHGRAQEQLATAQFNSALKRWSYAAYHLAETEKAINETNSKWGKLQVPDRMFLSQKVSSEEAAEYENSVNLVGAHTTACVANLHAVVELFAQGILHSLGMKSSDKKQFPERNVYSTHIQRKLYKNPRTKILGSHLEAMIRQGDYEYLAAVSNQSKHNQLVRAGIIMDVREQGDLPFWAAFEGFERKSFHGEFWYDRRDALETLTKEKDRQLDLIIDTGIELTFILQGWVL